MYNLFQLANVYIISLLQERGSCGGHNHSSVSLKNSGLFRVRIYSSVAP